MNYTYLAIAAASVAVVIAAYFVGWWNGKSTSTRLFTKAKLMLDLAIAKEEARVKNNDNIINSAMDKL